MVSLIDRASYYEKLKQIPKLIIFIEFLEGKNISLYEFSSTDQSFYNCIKSIQNENLVSFNTEYTELSRREPSETSPFVYDNYLLFILIYGTTKFNLNQDWILSILTFRNDSDEEAKIVTQTLKNLLVENYQSTENHFPTIIVFGNHFNESHLGLDKLNLTYREITQKPFPSYNSDFLNLISLKAYDIIVLKKDVLEKNTVSNLIRFEKKFINRVNTISKILHFILVGLIYMLLIYLYFTYPSFSKLYKENAGFLNSLGAGGIMILLLFSSKITNLNQKLLKKFWGYEPTIQA